jgi:pyruvate/2-oxoglutarate dehydrogenase complex dihydrolipoamide acyltransferase (E2) component
MIEITLPNEAWQDVEPGTEALLEEWMVAPGDTVKAGQTVAIVVMVKTSTEVAAPADGVIEEILIAKDDTVAQGKPLARMRAA